MACYGSKSKQQQQLSNVDIRALVCELLHLEREIEDFQELDELGKLYAIDWPFTSCSQLGLGGLFRLYSGRRCDGESAGSALDPADSADDCEQDLQQQQIATELQDANAAEKALRINRLLSVASNGVSGAGSWASPLKKRRRRAKSSLVANSLTWCKLLHLNCSSKLRGNLAFGPNAICCLSKSETMAQISASNSNQSNVNAQNQAPSTSPSLQELIGLEDSRLTSAIFEHDQDENDADSWLNSELCAKRDALELLGPLASQLRSGSWADAMRAQSFAQRTGRSLLLDPTNEAPLERGCRVSICLLDRRRHNRNRFQFELHAENGRRYALVRTRLAYIESRLKSVRDAAASKLDPSSSSSLEQVAKKLLANLNETLRQLDQSMRHQSIAIQASQLSSSKTLSAIPINPKIKINGSKSDSNEQLQQQQQQNNSNNSKKSHQMESLIELTKGSLNNLIDAQLLLRNKLKMELQQQSQSQLSAQTANQLNNPANSSQHSILAATCSTTNLSPYLIEHHYETLLRNNFNLLKIWQNLVETKKLASFVCEPIKATLSDLFWFSRERARLSHLVCKPSADLQLLTSPMLSLDALQVKRGLIQILEALNYLHLYCRLIHRNVTPANILIGSGDNWKLAGLEFAVRFESTTVSESNSIMRLESCATQTLSPTSNLLKANHFRRQRTLTKCPEFELGSGSQAPSGLLQPQLDYLAPEMLRKAQCSHKSDLFSFGLCVVQSYDFGQHKKPLACNSNATLYLQQIDRLAQSAQNRLHLTRLVPFEMRPLVCEMLECEPNLRPSANLAIQLLKRPIEFVDDTMDCVRHLKGALSELDGPGAWGGQQGAKFNHQTPSDAPANQANQTKHQRNLGRPNCATGAAGWNKGAKFFKKVTTLKRREPQPLEPRNVRLLSLYRRALDSMLSVPPTLAPSDTPTADWNTQNCASKQQNQVISFDNLKTEFELGLESLRQFSQLWSSTTATMSLGTSSTTSQFALHDSRSLLLSIALHRRLLDQVSAMRADLPPLSRLVQVLPSRLNENHKSLAELEDKFISLLCGQSLPRMWQSLADPMLKLDEFIIVFELVSDLLAFVGFKSRQAFSLRGKQLLNELTPPSACLSSSSSDDEEESQLQVEPSGLINFGDTSNELQHYATNSSQVELQQQQQASLSNMSNMSGMIPRYQIQNNISDSYSNTQAGAKNTEDNQLLPRGKSPTSSMHRYSMQANVISSQQLITQTTTTTTSMLANKLPNTKISITAPSPMGSVRDLSLPGRSPRRSLQPSEESELVERTQDLALNSNNRQAAAAAAAAAANGDQMTSNINVNIQSTEESGDEKSRNDLMDKLLSRINDDSFNKVIVDINHNKLAQQRPKSAIDHQTTTTTPTSRLATNSAANNPTSTNTPFDMNVIRRMSTNLVQNFNRMSGTNLGNAGTNNQEQYNFGASDPDNHHRKVNTQTTTTTNANNNASQQNNSNYATNSLYVDTQVPARRHSDNTINIPKIQVGGLSSSPNSHGSRSSLLSSASGPKQSVSVTKLANKWKLSTTQKGYSSQRDSSGGDKLSPALSSALGYMRRHSSGNTTGDNSKGNANSNDQHHSNSSHHHHHSNGHSNTHLLFGGSTFKTKSSSNLGLDFLISNRSMKRRCSAASMLGHQTQRKAEDLLDAGMKSMQNMFS